MSFLKRLLGKKGSADQRVDNTRLVRAMQDIAQADTPENRAKLYQLFLTSWLFVPVPELPANRAGKPEAATMSITLAALNDKNNQHVTPAFTDVEALQNWDPNTPYLAIRAQELFRAVKGTDVEAIIINPYDPIRKMLRPGGRIARFEFLALAEGYVPGSPTGLGVPLTIPAGQKVGLRVAGRPPAESILARLRETANRIPEIRALYVFEMVTAGDAVHTVVGIELNSSNTSDAGRIPSLMGNAIQPLLERNQSLDFMIVSEAKLTNEIMEAGKFFSR